MDAAGRHVHGAAAAGGAAEPPDPACAEQRGAAALAAAGAGGGGGCCVSPAAVDALLAELRALPLFKVDPRRPCTPCTLAP